MRHHSISGNVIVKINLHILIFFKLSILFQKVQHINCFYLQDQFHKIQFMPKVIFVEEKKQLYSMVRTITSCSNMFKLMGSSPQINTNRLFLYNRCSCTCFAACHLSRFCRDCSVFSNCMIVCHNTVNYLSNSCQRINVDLVRNVIMSHIPVFFDF